MDINKTVDTIKEVAYPLNLIQQKINKIFENAINTLSEMQEKIMIKYQEIFELQACSS